MYRLKDRSSNLCNRSRQPEFTQPRPPFDVKIRNFELLVQRLYPGMELLVHRLLPLGSGFVTEVHPTAERPDGVNRTEFTLLERASRTAPPGPSSLWQCRHESRQFQRRHVQPMPVLLKLAAPSRQAANRLAPLDFGRHAGVHPPDPCQHILPGRGVTDGGFQRRISHSRIIRQRRRPAQWKPPHRPQLENATNLTTINPADFVKIEVVT